MAEPCEWTIRRLKNRINLPLGNTWVKSDLSVGSYLMTVIGAMLISCQLRRDTRLEGSIMTGDTMTGGGMMIGEVADMMIGTDTASESFS
jgi:hypothetical protein